MDYELKNAPKSNDTILSIYNLDIEKADSSDGLYDVRKEFFKARHNIRGRLTLKCDDDIYKLSYSMEQGKVLNWKKFCGNSQCERTVPCDGGYRIECFDKSKRLYKKIFFSLEHEIIRVEFFADNRVIPTMIITPTIENSEYILIKTVNNQYEKLHAFTERTGKDITKELNGLTGEPQIFCKTSTGAYYYCTKDEIEVRTAALKKLLEVQSDEDVETVKSAFTIAENGEGKHINLSEAEAYEKTDTKKSEPQHIEMAKNAEDLEKTDKIEKIEKTEKRTIKVKPKKSENKSTEKEDNTTILTEPDTEIADENEELPIPSIDDSVFETVTKDEFIAEISKEDEKEKEPDSEDEGFVYEQVIPQELRETLCAFASDCPYENLPKKEIKTEKDRYFYFGELTDDMRDGRGRTAMENGITAYEGNYKDDKRSGFGAYYFKSGNLCYVGAWCENKREGLGTAYSIDGACYTGKWHNNKPSGSGASFNSEGELKYFGTYKDGKRDGAGVMTIGENVVVGIYQNGKFTGRGTIFAPSGALLYSGEMNRGERSGKGIEYNEDGTIHYNGEWRGGRYNGKGILYLADGGFIEGEFRYGAADGEGKQYDKNGKLIYEGLFANNLSSGNGRVYNSDGSYYEGRFSDGEANGLMSEYTAKGELVYSGEWKNGKRSGKGTEYIKGIKVYDGEFSEGVYCGEGRLYEDDLLVYAGSFKDGKKNGYGCKYENGSMVYRGKFFENEYNGCGICYSNGEISCVGMFKNGEKNGRINEISNGKIIRECIYSSGELVYMREYSEENGALRFDGNVRNGMRDGFGASFNEYGEKSFEGIFKAGQEQKNMSVILRKIEKLPKCDELADGEYDMYRKGTGYVVEYALDGGQFTGKLKNGKPDGKCTILYSDHRFTGEFVDGRIDGKGIIYMLDGEEIKGEFRSVEFEGSKKIELSNNKTYYYL